MKVGDLNVQPVWDGDARVRARDVLTPPGGDEAHWACNAEHFTAAGEFEMALGGFLIRTGDRVVLVDAGLGPFSARGFHGGHLLNSLTALGVQPPDVTDVAAHPPARRPHRLDHARGPAGLPERHLPLPRRRLAPLRRRAGARPAHRIETRADHRTGRAVRHRPHPRPRHRRSPHPRPHPRLDDLHRLQRPASRPAARRRRPLPRRTPRRRLGSRLRHRQPRRPGRPRPPHRRDRSRRHPRRLPALRRPALRSKNSGQRYQ